MDLCQGGMKAQIILDIILLFFGGIEHPYVYERRQNGSDYQMIAIPKNTLTKKN
jgi:hypothetical protein